MIKSAFSLCCVFLSFVLIMTSCGLSSENNVISEVDLSNVTDVQITYDQNVYNTRISYVSGVLYLNIISGAETLNGLGFEIDGENCRIIYSDMVRDMATESFSNNFFPLVIYNFISDFNGVILSEGYDDEKLCYYVSRQVFSSFVTFEIFENNQNKAYSLHIT